MCLVLEVSRSGYYAWRRRPKSNRADENERLVSRIRVIYGESRRTYGSPRVHAELVAQGECCNKKRVERLMRENGIQVEIKPKFKTTTDSNHDLPVSPNTLNRQFQAEAPDRKWLTDITYIWTSEGWLYLAVVLDLFSKMVVGWCLKNTVSRALVLGALKMALGQRNPDRNLLHHSDRGSQYASDEYQQLLEIYQMDCSMSRKADCWDNAPMESFFATLKKELVYRCVFLSREQAFREIFDYIEIFYNGKRRHSTLGYLSPRAFEQAYHSAMMREPQCT